MWVEPNGVVRVLTGVPFNVDYENTLYFANRTAQANYFISKTKYTFPKVTYQRLERNYMKVQINAESLYDCNYLMYQNTSFGNRWFYAFITGVDYVANEVTRIEYVIDEIQTWFWDCTLKQSYVERQHSIQDRIGSSLTDEPFGEMETVIRKKHRHGAHDMCWLMFFSKIPKIDVSMTDESEITENTMVFNVINGVGNGLYCVGYDLDRTVEGEYVDLIAMNHVLYNYNFGLVGLSPDDIVAIVQVNKMVFNITEGMRTDTLFFGSHYVITELNFNTVHLDPFTVDMVTNFKYNKNLGTEYYVPKNKKLYQYPFNYLEVSDCKTQSQVFDPAYLSSVTDIGTILIHFVFQYYVSGSIDPSFLVIPQAYKNYDFYSGTPPVIPPATGEDMNPEYMMVYKGSINCAWVSDSFMAWLAQNGGPIPVGYNMISDAVSRSFKTATIEDDEGKKSKVPYLDKKGLADSVMNSIQVISQARHIPNKVHGNYNADITYACGYSDFVYMEKQIPAELAERVDMFFQMYGYADKNVTIPNISSRPRWNYVKTVGLNIDAPIPEDDAQAIVKIFNSGIRFWKNPTEVGNYSLDNSPV